MEIKKKLRHLDNAQQIQEIEEIVGCKFPFRTLKHLDKYLNNILSWRK